MFGHILINKDHCRYSMMLCAEILKIFVHSVHVTIMLICIRNHNLDRLFIFNF